MRYTDNNGKTCEVGVNTSFCGIGFVEITLTPKDVKHPDFSEWFELKVLPRMMDEQEESRL